MGWRRNILDDVEHLKPMDWEQMDVLCTWQWEQTTTQTIHSLATIIMWKNLQFPHWAHYPPQNLKNKSGNKLYMLSREIKQCGVIDLKIKSITRILFLVTWKLKAILWDHCWVGILGHNKCDHAISFPAVLLKARHLVIGHNSKSSNMIINCLLLFSIKIW